VDVATAEHLVEKKRARGKTTTRYPDDPEMRDVYEEELRRLRLRAVLLVVIDLNVRRKMSVGRSGVEHSGQKNLRRMFDITSTLEYFIITVHFSAEKMYDEFPFVPRHLPPLEWHEPRRFLLARTLKAKFEH
jgi:UDP:flavonoid glycosyltransferase YjiC (YdhE family)